MIKYIIALIIIFFAIQEPAIANTTTQYEVWVDTYGWGTETDECAAYAATPYMIGAYAEYPDHVINIDPDFPPRSYPCNGGNVFYYSQIIESQTYNLKTYTTSYIQPAALRIQEITKETPEGEMCEEVVTLPIEPNSWEGEEISFDSLKNKFASKFPLDMVFLSSQNGGGNEDCPVFNLLGRSMPACIIIMLIKSAKWPILISIIIRTIFSI